uniref:Uncharacterized protein n=1 Tax=Cacopsylla melanoneura TaxID=428564 RepID=A0A8D8PMP1_9HEMI
MNPIDPYLTESIIGREDVKHERFHIVRMIVTSWYNTLTLHCEFVVYGMLLGNPLIGTGDVNIPIIYVNQRENCTKRQEQPEKIRKSEKRNEKSKTKQSQLTTNKTDV